MFGYHSRQRINELERKVVNITNQKEWILAQIPFSDLETIISGLANRNAYAQGYIGVLYDEKNRRIQEQQVRLCNAAALAELRKAP